MGIADQFKAAEEQKVVETKELPSQLNTSFIKDEQYNKFLEQAQNWLDTFKTAEKATAAEKKALLEYAASERLNPFKNEIYFIPFQGKWVPVTNYRIYLQRMWESGKVTMFNVETTPVLNKEGNKIDLKCVVTIKRKEMEVPAQVTGLLSEYNKNQGTWSSQPTLMLEKSVIVKTLRWYLADFINLPYEKDELTEETATIDIELKDIENVEEAILVEETNQGEQND